MTALKYSVTHPVRFLLPISGALIALPLIFQEQLMNVVIIPIFCFFGSYFIFLNFPGIAESLHSKPIYNEDLIVERTGNISDETFKVIHSGIMNFVLALLFAFFSEYIIIKQKISSKSPFEIIGLVGGNLGIYMGVQDTVGRVMLSICHYLKETEEEIVIIETECQP